jgi:hypothetical protein
MALGKLRLLIVGEEGSLLVFAFENASSFAHIASDIKYCDFLFFDSYCCIHLSYTFGHGKICHGLLMHQHMHPDDRMTHPGGEL